MTLSLKRIIVASVLAMPGESAEMEIRPLFDAEDFGDALTRERIASRHGS